MRDAGLFVPPLGLILVVVQWLFREAASEHSDRELFRNALDQFYRGQPDERTLALLR
ncbi:MAG: hypothetical protein WAN27_11915 [Xanthobacteraceae bacterium]|jgi:hypothetical protein